MPKKMLWKVGVYSCLSERFIRDGRDSAKRVVSDTDPPKSSPGLTKIFVKESEDSCKQVLAVGGAGDAVLLTGVDLHVKINA